MIQAYGYANKNRFSRLKGYAFERPAPAAHEVEVELLYCGVCHTDIHQVGNEWGNTIYPCMPGHEMTGVVRSVGDAVSRLAVGDVVGIGCMVDSCGTCAPCRDGDENYCASPNGMLQTFNGPVIPAKMASTGANIYGRDNTFGGYSDVMVVREDFVLKVPPVISPAEAAPILCAGVTTWSPLRHWKVGPGQKVGIVGLGGLGHMAVKLAHALGAEVTVITSSPDKRDAAERLGAAYVELEKDARAQLQQMSALTGQFDFILSTVPQKHDIDPFIVLLKRDCTIAVVGAVEPMASYNNQQVAFHRRSVSGSLIGSIRETQEVLDFCAEHGIRPEIEVIPIQQINEAHRAVEDGDVRFRYVIDLASLKEERAERRDRTSVIAP